MSLDAGPYFCKELTQYLVAVIIVTPLNLHAWGLWTLSYTGVWLTNSSHFCLNGIALCKNVVNQWYCRNICYDFDLPNRIRISFILAICRVRKCILFVQTLRVINFFRVCYPQARKNGCSFFGHETFEIFLPWNTMILILNLCTECH
jgi:hypothetical protein